MRTDEGDVVVLLAHQDDEFFAAPWILDERRNGRRVTAIVLTDGAARASSAVRDAESLAALAELGVSEDEISFLGSAHGIADGSLVEALERVYACVHAEVRRLGLRVVRLYAPEYEGGHIDHDAAALLAVRYARESKAQAWGYSLYHARGCRRPFFRTLKPQLRDGARFVRYGALEAIRLTALCRHYRSQWRTWLGLLPEAALRRLVQRREWVNPLDEGRLHSRPHAGPLLYEWMFGASYERFERAVAAFGSGGAEN